MGVRVRAHACPPNERTAVGPAARPQPEISARRLVSHTLAGSPLYTTVLSHTLRATDFTPERMALPHAASLPLALRRAARRMQYYYSILLPSEQVPIA